MRWAVWGRCPGSHHGGCGPSSLQVFDQHYQTKRSRVMLWALSTLKISFCFKDLWSYECKYRISGVFSHATKFVKMKKMRNILNLCQSFFAIEIVSYRKLYGIHFLHIQ